MEGLDMGKNILRNKISNKRGYTHINFNSLYKKNLILLMRHVNTLWKLFIIDFFQNNIIANIWIIFTSYVVAQRGYISD